MNDTQKDTGKLTLQRENPANVFITEDDVKQILNRYGVYVPIKNLQYYQQAFIHRSYLKCNNIIDEHVKGCVVPIQETCNERLELLGDCVLAFVVGSYLYDRYSGQQEGFLTKTRTKIVRGRTLAKLSQRVGFGKWIVISLHVENAEGRKSPRLLEDLFESFIGAIYLDNGGDPVEPIWFQTLQEYTEIVRKIDLMEGGTSLPPPPLSSQGEGGITPANLSEYIQLNRKQRELAAKIISTRSNGYLICQRFIISIMERELDLIKLIEIDDNYKEQLQKFFQRTYAGAFPKWYLLKQEGPITDRWYTVGINDNSGHLIGVGRARKKIDAEQIASKKALKHLGLTDDLSSDDEDTVKVGEGDV